MPARGETPPSGGPSAARPRFTGPRRPLLWVGAATVVVLAAFALISLRGGEDGSGGGPFSPVAEAAARTAEVPGARVAGSGTFSGGAVTMNTQFTGEFSGVTERSTMRMDVQTNVASPAAAQLSPLLAVQDGLTMYMSAPIFAGQLPDGKSWMKIDLSEVVSEPVEQSATDARAMLAQLEAAGEVTALGPERVRGVPTTRYSATIDSAAQAAQAREQGDDLVAEMLEQNPGISTSEVWIDRRGYVRRVATTVPFEVVGGPGAEMAMTMDFFDFGIEPQIDLPPEDATFDATELAIEGMEAALDES